MRVLKIAAVCLLVSLFTITCQKEHLPQESNGTPVFYFNGLVNGTNVSLQAGKNNYYMYSSDSQSVSGVYSYMGNLKEFNCNSGCVSSIKFIINNYRALGIGAQEKNITDSSLAIGSYNYFVPGGTPTKYALNFLTSMGTGSNPTRYTFQFGDGNSISGSGTPPAVIPYSYSRPGNYVTSLSVVFDSSHVTTLSNIVNPQPSNNSLYATALYTNPDYSTQITGGTPPYTLNWSFGDGHDTIITTPIPSDSIPHSYSTASQCLSSVTITDKNNLSTIVNANIVPNGGSQQYLMNYYYQQPSPLSNATGLSNITIIYTDASGDVYTTADSTQEPGNDFQITSIANYQNNENNQTTKQLHIKFNCTLYDSKKNPLTIKNGDAVIAVAYK